MSSLKYWVWLSSLSGVGNIIGRNLIDALGSPENIYHADSRDYLDIPGVDKAKIEKLMNKDIIFANEILANCAQTGCRVVTLQDADYPDRLRNIYDPPLVFYLKGNLPNVDDLPVVGIVGSRNCTPYGINAAETIGKKLSENGIIVSTGLADGIDTAAARGALGGNAPVIGVIGTGPDIVFPSRNRQLFSDVMSSGVLISEYPPGTPGRRHHFPARNRIISGLSLGVAVIEAPEKSGALITAARAIEQGRDVFALPGNIDAPSCKGSNKLLREGAIPFTSAEDIIEEYIDLFSAIKSEEKSNESNKIIDKNEMVDYIDLDEIICKLDGDEKTVAKIIGSQTLHIDDIIIGSELSAQQVLTTLTMLEIGGCIHNSNSKYYSLVSAV